MRLTASLRCQRDRNSGWSKIISTGLDVEKIEVAALALGIARAAVEDAWQYSQERVQFGKPICHNQSVRHMLSEVKTKFPSLFKKVFTRRNRVRAIIIAATDIFPISRQLSLFDQPEIKQNNISSVLDKVRAKFGQYSIHNGFYSDLYSKIKSLYLS